jgi:hypothetical protein
MCIICVKQTDEMTSQHWKWLEESFRCNSDGGGFMWREKNAVHISKGYMQWAEMEAAISHFELEKTAPVVFHFRRATHGAVCPGLTHPFPLAQTTQKLMKVDTTTNVGIVHNGILAVPPIAERDGLSDTAWLIQNSMAILGPKIVMRPAYLRTLAQSGDKFVFLSPDHIRTVGTFIAEDEGAWAFSNRSYTTPRYTTDTSRGPGWYAARTWDNKTREWELKPTIATAPLTTSRVIHRATLPTSTFTHPCIMCEDVPTQGVVFTWGYWFCHACATDMSIVDDRPTISKAKEWGE